MIYLLQFILFKYVPDYIFDLGFYQEHNILVARKFENYLTFKSANKI